MTASLIYMEKYTYNNDCDANEKANIIMKQNTS